MTETSQNTHTYSWASFPIGKLGEEITQGSTALIGHYLFVFAHCTRHIGSYNSKLWMVDLRDTSVQSSEQEFRFFSGNATEHYSFNIYGENQMIKFGGDASQSATNELIWMTIESFDPLKIDYEHIKDENAPNAAGHTAAVYQDCLFVFGGRSKGTHKIANSNLWCFDLRKRTWTLCQTTGKGPKSREGAKSFVIYDNLYIYGGFSRAGKVKVSYSELFELNLKTMKWKRIEQKDPHPGQDSTFFDRFSVDTYGENIIVIKNEKEVGYDRVYSCNRHDLGSWSTIKVAGLGGIRTIGNSVLYKNVLYIFATKNTERKQLFLAALDLASVGLSLPRSLEEEHWNSLFMSENESDISFKIQGKIIPSHKKVLIQKCRFFASLFNSGMMESRVEVIDIDDCEYDIFQEFLRFLYCGTINTKQPQVMKLFSLADKYVQEDLYERCASILALNVTSKNICRMHNFARKKGIVLLNGWCMKFFEYSMNYDYIAQFVEYVQDLERQYDQEYEADDRQLIERAVNEILERISTILQEDTKDFENFMKDKKRVEFFEGFLAKHVTTENIMKFTEKFGEFKNQVGSLRMAVLNFVLNNLEFLRKEEIDFPLSTNFGKEFFGYKSRKDKEKQREEAFKKDTDPTQRKAIKRMDPKSDFIETVKTDPTLKKIKKSIPVSRY